MLHSDDMSVSERTILFSIVHAVFRTCITVFLGDFIIGLARRVVIFSYEEDTQVHSGTVSSSEIDRWSDTI